MTTDHAATASEAAGHIVGVNPATGQDTGWSLGATAPEALTGIVAAARVAGAEFAKRDLEARKRVVRALGAALLARADAIGAVLHEELGKPLGEAWTSEIVTTGELFDYWLGAIDDLLAPIDVPLNPLNYPGK